MSTACIISFTFWWWVQMHTECVPLPPATYNAILGPQFCKFWKAHLQFWKLVTKCSVCLIKIAQEQTLLTGHLLVVISNGNAVLLPWHHSAYLVTVIKTFHLLDNIWMQKFPRPWIGWGQDSFFSNLKNRQFETKITLVNHIKDAWSFTSVYRLKKCSHCLNNPLRVHGFVLCFQKAEIQVLLCQRFQVKLCQKPLRKKYPNKTEENPISPIVWPFWPSSYWFETPP